MKNLEKLGYSKDETVDEIAVGMLLEQIKNDVWRDCFGTTFLKYIGLYKSMKEWLESEVEK